MKQIMEHNIKKIAEERLFVACINSNISAQSWKYLYDLSFCTNRRSSGMFSTKVYGQWCGEYIQCTSGICPNNSALANFADFVNKYKAALLFLTICKFA